MDLTTFIAFSCPLNIAKDYRWCSQYDTFQITFCVRSMLTSTYWGTLAGVPFFLVILLYQYRQLAIWDDKDLVAHACDPKVHCIDMLIRAFNLLPDFYRHKKERHYDWYIVYKITCTISARTLLDKDPRRVLETKPYQINSTTVGHDCVGYH